MGAASSKLIVIIWPEANCAGDRVAALVEDTAALNTVRTPTKAGMRSFRFM